MLRPQAELEEMFEGRIFWRAVRTASDRDQRRRSVINKGTALVALWLEIGTRREEVMALGDKTNDTHPPQAAGLAVAVGNAVPRSQERTRTTSAKGSAPKASREAVEKFMVDLTRQSRSRNGRTTQAVAAGVRLAGVAGKRGKEGMGEIIGDKIAEKRLFVTKNMASRACVPRKN